MNSTNNMISNDFNILILVVRSESGYEIPSETDDL